MRFLLVASYLLKGDYKKGINELQEFSKYYSRTGGKQFKINDVWSFIGLTNFIGSSAPQKDKDILFDIINILKGSRQDWTRINAVIEQSNKERRASTIRRRKIILVVAGIAAIATIAGIYTIYETFKANLTETAKAAFNAGFIKGKISASPCEQIPKHYSFSVGDTITDTLLDPSNNSRLYMADYDLGQILVFDATCKKQVKALPVGIHPVNLEFSNNKLYVANLDSNSLSVIDTKSEDKNGKLTWNTITIPHVGPAPRDVTVYGSKIFVASQDSDNISIIDTSTGISKQFPVGHKQSSLEFDPVSKRLYILDNSKNILSITTENGKVIKNIVVGSSPVNLKYNSNTKKIYVANSNSSSVSIIGMDSPYAVNTITVGKGPTDLTIDNTTNEVYVVSYGSKSVTVLDGKSNKIEKTFPISLGGGEDNPLTVELDKREDEIFVTTAVSNLLYRFDSQNISDSFTNIYTERYPKSMAYNDKTNEILVANSLSDSVSVINTESNKIKNTYKVLKYPNDVIYNSRDNLFYVANYYNNSISILNGSTYGAISNITIGKNPGALYFDNSSSKLYVTGEKTVSVLDVANNYSVKTIGNRSTDEYGYFHEPVDVTMDPKTKNVFVANYGDSSISVLSTETEKDYSLIKKITVGKSPNELLFNDKSRNLYVVNSGSKSLSVISGDKLYVKRSVPVGTGSLFSCV